MVPTIHTEAIQDVASLLKKFSPEQGGVEYQTDQPGKEHAWHSHSVHETLVVIEGGMTLAWKGPDGTEERVEVIAGDRIELPANTIHKSVNEGAKACRYLIAPEGGIAATTTRY